MDYSNGSGESDSDHPVDCSSPEKFRTLRRSDKLVLRTSRRADGNCSSSDDHNSETIILAPISPLNVRHPRLVLKRKMKYVMICFGYELSLLLIGWQSFVRFW